MASNYEQLVKALRFETDYVAVEKTMRDAADAIEALQAEVQELKRVNLEIFEDLPKLGEWIWDDKRCIYVCSVCGSPKVRENMDRQIIKEQAYCYSCGAKMDGKEKDDE